MKRFSQLTCFVVLLLAGAVSGTTNAALPDPGEGGPGNQPISLLIIDSGNHGVIDKTLKQNLKDKGYKITIQKSFAKGFLEQKYLKNYSVLILTGFPQNRSQYGPGSWRMSLALDKNTAALRQYVENGGSLLFLPEYGGGGLSSIRTYNEFLKPFEIRYLAEQVLPSPDHVPKSPSWKNAYAEGVIHQGHPVTKGLEHLLYPTSILRWDVACSTNPVIPESDDWNIHASAKEGHGTYVVRGSFRVYPDRSTEHRHIWASRTYEKGAVAVSGINTPYVFSHAYRDQKRVGESGTGPLKGIFMEGIEDGRPSEGAKLLDRTLRYLGKQSAANDVGGKTAELTNKISKPDLKTTINWQKRELPPTWASKVVLDRGHRIYDPYADPTIDEVNYYKALIGPRTAYSVGKGSVKKWRKAAKKAGYNAIMFAEKMEQTTRRAYNQLIKDCRKNSDEDFICVPGLDVADTQETRYLIIGASHYPLEQWLTDDGTRVKRTANMTLGVAGPHVTAVHRPSRSGMTPQMFEHYFGITAATYNAKGKLIDDGLYEYQWAIRSDCNPVPISAHELTHPDQVAKAAQTGFQQIMPAPSPRRAVDKFLNPVYFASPSRYFISEGPILDDWIILNKDVNKPEWNRRRYRVKVGVRSDNANISRVTLYDGFHVERRWRPDSEDFDTVVAGVHGQQHLYMLLAEDEKGRRVLSPQIRTVPQNYPLRCGDRQNWLGTVPNNCLYGGWRQGYGHLQLPLRNARESTGYWNKQAVFYEFPFFSNHFAMTDIIASKKFVNAWAGPGLADSSPVFNVQTKDFTETRVRTLYANPPKSKKFNVMSVEVHTELKRDMEPVIDGPVYPYVDVGGKGKKLILPGEEPRKMPAEELTEVPAGTYIGGWIPLTEGLVLKGDKLGFPAPSEDKLFLKRGREWNMRYLRLSGSRWWWRGGGEGKIEPVAEKALRQMGFRGESPYSFELDRGSLENLGYYADFKAPKGGVAGELKNPENQKLLFNVPLRIHGVNGRQPAALWRSDQKHLEWFGVHREKGYIPLNADKTVDFYAGNVVRTDSRLFVGVLTWTKDTAKFRVNNPTDHKISASFATVKAIPDRKQIEKQITVPAGGSVDVGE